MMSLPRRLLVAAAPIALTASSAQAHGLIGKRFFPATLATDDPFVADELSLPTISYLKLRGDDDAADEADQPERRVLKAAEPRTRHLARGTFTMLDPDEGSSVSGFDNLEISRSTSS